MSILVIGENTYDFIFSVNIELKSDSNAFPEKAILRPGGTGFNFSLAFKRMGGQPFYFCPISKDSFGSIIREEIKKEGIEFGYFESDKPTPLIITLLNEKYGRNTIANIFNSSYTDVSFEHFVSLGKDFTDVYVSGGILTEEKPQKEVLKIVRLMYGKGAQIFYDPQFRIGRSIPKFKNTAIEILQISDFILANEEEIKNFPEDILKDCINKGAVIVYKRGENGAGFVTKDKTFDVEGIKVKRANITGAGDVFNAAFIYKVLSNQRLENSLIFANEIASEYVSTGDYSF